MFFTLVRLLAHLSTFYRLYKFIPKQGRRRPSKKQWTLHLSRCLFLIQLDLAIGLCDRLAQWIWIPLYSQVKWAIWVWVLSGAHGADTLWIKTGRGVLQKYKPWTDRLDALIDGSAGYIRPLSQWTKSLDPMYFQLARVKGVFTWRGKGQKRTGLTPSKVPIRIFQRPQLRASTAQGGQVPLETPFAPGAYASETGLPTKRPAGGSALPATQTRQQRRSPDEQIDVHGPPEAQIPPVASLAQTENRPPTAAVEPRPPLALLNVQRGRPRAASGTPGFSPLLAFTRLSKTGISSSQSTISTPTPVPLTSLASAMMLLDRKPESSSSVDLGRQGLKRRATGVVGARGNKRRAIDAFTGRLKGDPDDLRVFSPTDPLALDSGSTIKTGLGRPRRLKKEDIEHDREVAKTKSKAVTRSNPTSDTALRQPSQPARSSNVPNRRRR